MAGKTGSTMSVKLSWKVDLDVSVSGDRAPQEILLTVSRGSPIDASLLAPFRAGMADLTNCVNHGAMCGAKIEPTESAMRLVELAVNPDGDLQTRFEIAGVDPGAWRTITALAVFFTYGSTSPAVRIASSSNVSNRSAITQSKVWSLPYPGLPEILPFRLEREENPTFDVLLRIRFRKKLDAETKKAVLGAMKSWSTLLFGGYPDDGEDMTACSTSSNEAYMIDPRTVEYAAEYRGHAAALDAAVLIAIWFHERGVAVESVLIE
jgi:hypothetical protein